MDLGEISEGMGVPRKPYYVKLDGLMEGILSLSDEELKVIHKLKDSSNWDACHLLKGGDCIAVNILSGDTTSEIAAFRDKHNLNRKRLVVVKEEERGSLIKKPEYPYIFVTDKGQAWISLEDGVRLTLAWRDYYWGLYSYIGADCDTDDYTIIKSDIIKHESGSYRDRYYDDRRSCDLAFYLNWMSFAGRAAQSSEVALDLLRNDMDILLDMWEYCLRNSRYNTEIFKYPSDIVKGYIKELSKSEHYGLVAEDYVDTDSWSGRFYNVKSEIEKELEKRYPIIY